MPVGQPEKIGLSSAGPVPTPISNPTSSSTSTRDPAASSPSHQTENSHKDLECYIPPDEISSSTSAMDSPTRRGVRARAAQHITSSSHAAYPAYTAAPPASNSLSPSTSRSSAAATLALPNLPRFHPANFPSSSSNSSVNTPGTGPVSPQAPVSPRTPQRQYSEAQRALYAYQREMLASQGSRPTSSRQVSGGAGSSTPYGGVPFPMMTGMTFPGSSSGKPDSPKLVPLAGSPGPVTPLELENEMKGGDYLSAGARRREGEGN